MLTCAFFTTDLIKIYSWGWLSNHIWGLRKERLENSPNLNFHYDKKSVEQINENIRKVPLAGKSQLKHFADF